MRLFYFHLVLVGNINLKPRKNGIKNVSKHNDEYKKKLHILFIKINIVQTKF